MKDLLDDFCDDLANWWRLKETGRSRNWAFLDESIKNYWREQSRPMLEFMAKQGVMIQTPGGIMKLKDLLSQRIDRC